MLIAGLPRNMEANLNAGELRSVSVCHGFRSACRWLVVPRVDVAGDTCYPLGCAGLSVGVLVPAAERGLDLAGADAGPDGPAEPGEDGAADVALQVAAGIDDIRGGGDQVLRGLDGELPAGPVRIQAGHGLDRVGH